MRVTEIISEKSNRVKICLDNGVSFPLYQGEADRYHLKEGRELSAQSWEEIRGDILEKRAKMRALYLLQRADRTEYQLRQKLKTDGYPEEVTETALNYVKSFHYVDDLRYASAYIRCHKEKKSRLQLKTALQQRGIRPELIEQALAEEYEQDEETLILKLLEKKHYDPAQSDRREKQRIYQYLMRRGFSGSAVRRMMESFPTL